MNRFTSFAVLIAALTSVTASAQILTNYGDITYPDASYGGSWDGSSGRGINSGAPGTWAAQTFIAPVGGLQVYAYNFQLGIDVVSASRPSFTTAIYEWTGTTLGAMVANSDATFTDVANRIFEPAGANVVTNPGLGTSALTAGGMYALVIHRLDPGTTGTVQVGYDLGENPVGNYEDGMAYRSIDGTTFSLLGGGSTDFAFWVSFDPNTLSPDQLTAVPEPAVNGAILGAVFVAGLAAWRRRSKNKNAGTPLAAA
jgi:hypothetical protein